MMDVVSEKLVLGTGAGAPPTAPSGDIAESLLTAGEARTQLGDDGVPTSSQRCHYSYYYYYEPKPRPAAAATRAVYSSPQLAACHL